MLPPPSDEKPYFGDDGGEAMVSAPYAPAPYNPAVVPPPAQSTNTPPQPHNFPSATSNPPPQAGPLPTKAPPGPNNFHSIPAPPYSEQPPASHTALPYVSLAHPI